MKRRMAAILVADIVGYSGLMEADEEGTAQRLANCRNLIDAEIVKCEGRRSRRWVTRTSRIRKSDQRRAMCGQHPSRVAAGEPARRVSISNAIWPACR